MESRIIRRRPVANTGFLPFDQRRRLHWSRGAVCIAVIATLYVGFGLAQQGKPPAVSGATPSETMNAPSDAHDSATASSDRQKQIAEASSMLLSMAVALKSEVDKATAETLSVPVMRQADAIEKLAHEVKGKSKPKAGGR